MRKTVALLAFVFLASCGSNPPTAGTPGPPNPPPADNVDWAALDAMFSDPLYLRLPRLLADQTAAQPLNDAVTSLVSAIAAHNLDIVRQQLIAIPLHRNAYLTSAQTDARDRPLLDAMALFEMRGLDIVPQAAPLALAPQAEITILPEGGQQ